MMLLSLRSLAWAGPTTPRMEPKVSYQRASTTRFAGSDDQSTTAANTSLRANSERAGPAVCLPAGSYLKTPTMWALTPDSCPGRSKYTNWSGPTRRDAVASRIGRTDLRPAAQRGQAARDQGPVAHEQGRAGGSPGPLGFRARRQTVEHVDELVGRARLHPLRRCIDGEERERALAPPVKVGGDAAGAFFKDPAVGCVHAADCLDDTDVTNVTNGKHHEHVTRRHADK